jgi:tripartite-type tricarboxylate transporter receptor subunit TctC
MQVHGLRLTSLAIFAALASTQPAQSQEWPQKPARIIVPFAAGGSSDVAARILAQRLGNAFGQQFVVDNRAGASGVLVAEAVARSPVDGYTLFMATAAQISITPAMTKTSYDPVRDFAPVSGRWNQSVCPGRPSEHAGPHGRRFRRLCA